MLLRYFLVDAEDQFRLVPRTSMEDVWAGRRTTRVFDWPVGIKVSDRVRRGDIIYKVTE